MGREKIQLAAARTPAVSGVLLPLQKEAENSSIRAWNWPRCGPATGVREGAEGVGPGPAGDFGARGGRHIEGAGPPASPPASPRPQTHRNLLHVPPSRHGVGAKHWPAVQGQP